MVAGCNLGFDVGPKDTGWAHPTWPPAATLTSQRNKVYVWGFFPRPHPLWWFLVVRFWCRYAEKDGSSSNASHVYMWQKSRRTQVGPIPPSPGPSDGCLVHPTWPPAATLTSQRNKIYVWGFFPRPHPLWWFPVVRFCCRPPPPGGGRHQNLTKPYTKTGEETSKHKSYFFVTSTLRLAAMLDGPSNLQMGRGTGVWAQPVSVYFSPTYVHGKHYCSSHLSRHNVVTIAQMSESVRHTSAFKFLAYINTRKLWTSFWFRRTEQNNQV